VDYARAEAELSAIVEGTKETLRMQLENVYRQTGKKPRQLIDAPELPECGRYLWMWFVDMNNSEREVSMTVSRITASSMIAWQWATGNILALWERKALRAIDAVWIEAQRCKS